MDINSFVEAISRVFSLITASPASTVLTIFGFGLLIVAGVLAYWAPQRTSALVVSLVGGIFFGAAGASAALLIVEKNTIRKMGADQAFKNLENNAEVHHVIRLIAY